MSYVLELVQADNVLDRAYPTTLAAVRREAKQWADEYAFARMDATPSKKAMLADGHQVLYTLRKIINPRHEEWYIQVSCDPETVDRYNARRMQTEAVAEPSGEQLGLVSQIIAYESGCMTDEAELLRFFQQLVDTGLAWKLQGHYGRTASNLLKNGYIQLKGADNG